MKNFFVAVLLSMATTLSAADLHYIAHRGEYMTLPEEPAAEVRKGRVDAPEGTRPAFERVRDNRVNAVKLDIQYTPDKVVVISHDTNLKRTTGHDLPIATTRFEDLKNVPFLKKGAFEGERIITLDEALGIVKDCQLFYVDFKAYTPEMMEDAFKIFEKHGIATERIVIATFTKSALRAAQTSHPEVRRVLHISYTEQPDGTFQVNGSVCCADFEEVKSQLQAWREEMDLYGFNIPVASPNTTPALVRELKAEGCWVTLWYGHSTEVADRFHDSGVDGFVTGMPSSLRAYIEGKSQKP